MRLLTSKSNFAKNRCKIPMAALVPFLLFGCSGGKSEKSDAGEKSKDVRVQTTGSDEQRKLAMAATAVPGVSVSAVFGADADRLMAFGLKQLGKSGDSLSLAGPVYKLSATAELTPGPDGCFAILPVTSGSICYDEKISATRFLVPSTVPGTSAVPGLGLTENRQKSSDSSKICTRAQQGFDEVCFFACGRPPKPKTEDEIKPPVSDTENQQGNRATVDVAPERKSTEGPVTIRPVAAAQPVFNNPHQNEPNPSPNHFFPMHSVEQNNFPEVEEVKIVSAESLTASQYPVAPTPTSETTTETLPMPPDQMIKMDYSNDAPTISTNTESTGPNMIPVPISMTPPSPPCDPKLCPQPMPAPNCIRPKLEAKPGECCPTLVCTGGFSTPSCKTVGCPEGKECIEMCASCMIGADKCPEFPCTSTCM